MRSALPPARRTRLLLRLQNDEDELVAAYNCATSAAEACGLWAAMEHVIGARRALGAERWPRPRPEAADDGDDA